MWIYEKKLQFPVKITRPDARMAKIMIEQYGGCDGEWGAAHRYLSQRYSMVTPEAKATLNDIATEELGHAEIMGTIVRQLMQGLTKDQIIEGGLEAYYVNHGFGVYPCSAAGVPFSAAAFQSKGDPITDLYEDMAAEQKARSTYEYLIDLAEDPDVLAPLRFLREREVVHFQRQRSSESETLVLQISKCTKQEALSFSTGFLFFLMRFCFHENHRKKTWSFCEKVL